MPGRFGQIKKMENSMQSKYELRKNGNSTKMGKIDGSWMKEDCEKACEPKLPKRKKQSLCSMEVKEITP